ncbi:MAG: class I SAM-dependent methyltransferase [Rhodospirillaceae bacterium]|nr:class I SAM-dependent methyltransferase [Rhodospirillaceae bacterium]
MDDRSFVAGQSFILEAKKYWTSTLYPELKAEYRRRAAKVGGEPDTVEGVRALIEDTTLYRYFAWLERRLQRFKYSGRYGLVPYHRERRDELLAPLAAHGTDPNLDLDPDLEMPRYYNTVDIHQHPGGVWSDDFAGFVYERGARSTTPLIAGDHRDLHQRFTDRITEGQAPKRVLDMGCGFGKSTRPFYESFPDAEIEAIDLSGPCVALGAHDAQQAQASNTRFRQMNSYETDYEDQSFDLVTSTMLIHELPPAEIERTFSEAYRLLESGGRMAHLDFYTLPDAFSQFIHYGHGRRNNEPFMQPWAEMDVTGVLESIGFRNVEIASFAEAEGVDLADSQAWRFPWTVVAAEK